MLRGAQKQMIVVKTADSRIFEEAYFVLRKERAERETDILAEASRIIEGCGNERGKRERSKFKENALFIGSFICGGTFGGVLVGIIMFLV